MVGLGHIAFDGTKLKANASVRQSRDRDGLEKEMERIKEQVGRMIEASVRIDEVEEQEARRSEPMLQAGTPATGLDEVVAGTEDQRYHQKGEEDTRVHRDHKQREEEAVAHSPGPAPTPRSDGELVLPERAVGRDADPVADRGTHCSFEQQGLLHVRIVAARLSG
jgi:hypothetical protein